MDRRSPWSKDETVAGFVQSPPNETLMAFAGAELARLPGGGRTVDIGCGAGRNALPLTANGWDVLGIDSSLPMLEAADNRRRDLACGRRLHLALGAMDALPVRDGCADLVIAHGIWNLARSAREFRQAVREAGRVSRPGAALFVFTFSRNTLPHPATPVRGEPFVFTGFSGEPQCFLNEAQLVDELGERGFVPDPRVPLREHNLPRPGMLRTSGVPVVYEGAFRYHART